MENTEREISLQELFSVIWKGKIIIIIITIVVLGITIGGTIMSKNSKSQVSTVVSLQWNGISDGQYPDGTSFNYKNTIQPYVISEAIDENSGLDVNDNQVRNAISIKPIIPNSALAAIEKAIKDGETANYYATNYKITINNGSLGISVDQARDLLSDIIDNYRSDFNRRYIQQALIMDLTNIDFNELEYIDAYRIFESQMDLITKTVEIKLVNAQNFISSKLNIGFNDILIRSNLLNDTKLNQIASRINTYYLSKDIDYLLTKYSYQIDMLELDLAEAKAKEINLSNLVANYSGSTEKIIIPGMDPSQVIEIDTYYNTLIGKLVSQQNEIAELESKINYINIQINRFSGEDANYTVTTEEQTAQKIKVEADIEASIPIIKQIVCVQVVFSYVSLKCHQGILVLIQLKKMQ